MVRAVTEILCGFLALDSHIIGQCYQYVKAGMSEEEDYHGINPVEMEKESTSKGQKTWWCTVSLGFNILRHIFTRHIHRHISSLPSQLLPARHTPKWASATFHLARLVVH